MEKKGIYIYGIINSNQKLFFGPDGISPGDEVYTVPYREISAVVSESEIVAYADMRRDSLAMFLVRHQKTIEKIMGTSYTIIPLRLGTFVQDEGEIKQILTCGYSIVKDIFSKISDMVEINIAAVWNDFNSILKEIGENKEIKEFKESLLTGPAVTLANQMKAGFMVGEALERKKEWYSQEILNTIKSVSQTFKTHELMDEKMVINSAFLIDKDKQEEFNKKVEELDVKFNGKLNFRCVGPLPPYSFYTLEIKKLEFEEIDWAKKRLGIFDDITSKEDLKRVYWRQASSTHPDKNPNEPFAEKEFDEVNKAQKILADYCIALEQASSVGNKKSLNGANQQDYVSLSRETFKENPLLVRIRE